MVGPQQTLEQYVSNRYVHELSNSGYQPQHVNAGEMLEDALKIMASLNQASQFLRKGLGGGSERAAPL